MSRITLLDGSIGQEIVHRAGDRPTPLWSASVMIEKPGIVGDVHNDYFAAGATIATTNTYTVLRDRLEPVGMADKLPELLDCALCEAEAARSKHGSGRIAGALGPLMASYRPELCPPPEEAERVYDELVQIMAPRVDLFSAETMASVEQAEGAMRAAVKSGKPVWLSVTVDDDDGSKLRSGEGVEELAQVVGKYQPEAVLVNCSRPEAVATALEIIKGFGKPFGAYANGFTRISDAFLEDRPTVDVLEARTDLDPVAYADFAMCWVDMGATIVGGCCEVGPAHIAELAHRLKADGHEIV
ncbi:homocysteine S-methyltransferase family protein [Pseudohalocynthiibacter aestuariivivens]|jgi:S-methylmethionine-dependent homocysteine/selenocysteine methylase|uniref:Homocysteine S-methyltransferase family protein n=1 Tax=Pseudohalocynthiibacter aestuariivivens TaxID=1591409 RepID=A0ABV5JDN7_9RHOB|nr:MULTISPECIES: homocysteine S-methyltransferase family protein [Pseudohalocynthiibacter]MBS9717981.1 homocysteine S-methyltransferase family protein [Pseudohalocynthiibacter aestuariivivens]MCK0103153.1 homocysteine S-methyltransferase family protein [Pseudohalocynthiibacter sp. F2068]